MTSYHENLPGHQRFLWNEINLRNKRGRVGNKRLSNRKKKKDCLKV